MAVDKQERLASRLNMTCKATTMANHAFVVSSSNGMFMDLQFSKYFIFSLDRHIKPFCRVVITRTFHHVDHCLFDQHIACASGVLGTHRL